MKRGILIALLVPAIALAGPKKPGKGKGGKGKVEEPVEKTDDKGKADAAAPAPSTPAGGAPPTTLGGAQAAPTTPSQPAPQAPPPGNGSAAPPEAADGDTDKPTGKEVDVDTLRQEYLTLRDELFKSRARANAVAGQLYSTRMTIKFTWGSGRYYGVSKASIRLDGATVYEDATGAIATDDGVRFDGYIAPGRHLVTFHVEATGKDDDSFTSVTETQVVVKAVGNKDLVVVAKGRDNGDIAYEWKRSEKGNYGLGIDVSVKTVASGLARGKK